MKIDTKSKYIKNYFVQVLKKNNVNSNDIVSIVSDMLEQLSAANISYLYSCLKENNVNSNDKNNPSFGEKLFQILNRYPFDFELIKTEKILDQKESPCKQVLTPKKQDNRDSLLDLESFFLACKPKRKQKEKEQQPKEKKAKIIKESEEEFLFNNEEGELDEDYQIF